MQIQNDQTQTFIYQNTNQNKKLEEENSYENFVASTKTAKEDEVLFRAILEDDKISTSEVKNLSYEQMAKLNQLFKDLNSETFFIKGFDIFHKSNVSNDENLNKAIFETLKNKDDETQRTLFSLDLKAKLGYNRPRLPFEKSIEEEIAQRIAFEKEKYKDFPNKDEIMENLRKELKNWEIIDYGSFIDKTLFQLRKDISNPSTSEDAKYYLLKNLPYYEDLQKNYNQIQKETKYA